MNRLTDANDNVDLAKFKDMLHQQSEDPFEKFK